MSSSSSCRANNPHACELQPNFVENPMAILNAPRGVRVKGISPISLHMFALNRSGRRMPALCFLLLVRQKHQQQEGRKREGITEQEPRLSSRHCEIRKKILIPFTAKTCRSKHEELEKSNSHPFNHLVLQYFIGKIDTTNLVVVSLLTLLSSSVQVSRALRDYRTAYNEGKQSMYIYIYRERERDRCVYIHIQTYMCTDISYVYLYESLYALHAYVRTFFEQELDKCNFGRSNLDVSENGLRATTEIPTYHLQQMKATRI